MKVLLVTCKPPYPTVDGGCFASKRLIDTLLSQGNEVKLLTIATQKHPFKKEEHPKEVNPESVQIDTSVTISGAIKHLFNSRSYNVERFKSLRMKEVILATMERSQYDCVIFDSLFSTPYLEDVQQSFDGKIFLRAHNFESDIWQQKAKSSGGLKKLYLQKLAKDIAKYEKTISKKVDSILTISNEDKIRFESLGLNAKVETIPVAIDTSDSVSYDKNQPFFIGGMEWEPNILAVQKAIDILKKVNDSSIQFQLAGKGTEQFEENPLVKVHGRVDCAISFMKKNGFLFAPIESGSGVRIKILEAMSVGIPVLTTDLGASGIDKDALLISNEDSKTIEILQKLIKNQDFRQEIGQKGRFFIENELKLNKIGEKLQSIIND